MRSQGVPVVDAPGWRKLQIAAAQPVTSKNTSFRSDELLGTNVRTPQNEALGSVEDLVMSPQTGKIAYLVIARGGIFGFDEKYVPVPWDYFKVSPARNLLVPPDTSIRRVRRWMPTGRRTSRTKATTDPTDVLGVTTGPIAAPPRGFQRG
jgi:sporulation protein YlmC with PRC-barrel domain